MVVVLRGDRDAAAMVVVVVVTVPMSLEAMVAVCSYKGNCSIMTEQPQLLRAGRARGNGTKFGCACMQLSFLDRRPLDRARQHSSES